MNVGEWKEWKETGSKETRKTWWANASDRSLLPKLK